jgi:hypothetical protein
VPDAVRAGGALTCLLAVLIACGPNQVSQPQSTASVARTKPTPATQSTATAIYMVEVETLTTGASTVTNTGDALHVVTVRDGVPSDRLIESADQLRILLAAAHGFAIEIDGLRRDGSDPLVMVDLDTGVRRFLGTMDSLGIDDRGREGGVVSPDGSQVAIGSSHKIVLMQLLSGAERTLLGPSDPSTWFLPLRWTADGILVTEVGYEGLGYGRLTLVDPVTGSLSVVRPSPNLQLAVSPSGQWLATTASVDLGDGPTVRYPWQNTLNLTAVGGGTSRIATEKNRWFVPLDVSEAGQLLFSSDIQSGGAIAPDMGLYLATNGHVVQQVAETFRGEFGDAFYGAAAFLDPTTALVARIRGGFDAETSVDVELVHLCADTSGGCQITSTPVSSTPGIYPTAIGNPATSGGRGFLVLPAAQ